MTGQGAATSVLVTPQRRARTYGYFAPERFTGRTEHTGAHELGLNPDGFIGRTDELILSTLAHEMAHIWQQAHGTPPRRSHHDCGWAGKMKEIGLQPSATGEPGGRETSQSMSHYILPEGAYAKAYAELKASGFRLHRESAPDGKQGGARAKQAASKT
jgi:hypothetical protein